MKKATNSALMRIKNEKIILSIINKKPISRTEIAKATGLTKAAITIIVDDLKKRNIVFEKPSRTDVVGRNPMMLYINSSVFYVIGINITRFYLYVGISDLAGRIIIDEKVPVSSPDIAIKLISCIIDKQLAEKKIDSSKIYKLSVVTPGPIDKKHGLILNPPNFNDWHNFPIVRALAEQTGFDVVFENVSSATAISEKYFGTAKGTDNFLMLLVDEGIGSGIVKNDILFDGPCEFGHISINHNGEICECGNRGCLEKYASVPSILSDTKFSAWNEIVDNDCTEIIEKEAEYLCSGIISANNIFGFEKIVLCGDVAYKPDKLIDILSKKISNQKLINKELKVSAGLITSKCLIAASVGIHDLF